MEEMEIEKESNGSTPRKRERRESGFHLRPVEPEESGEGLPYAPMDWPNLGDTWRWKVGRRVTITGHYMDRYLYLPNHLRRGENSTHKVPGFASKLAVERYIRSAFPGADIKEFFASFTWKIPSKQATTNGNMEGRAFLPLLSEETEEFSASDSQSDGSGCKAGNKKCNSLSVKVENPPVAAMPCHICCTEPRFCRDCCCILCCKTVNSNHGGYSYIKCEAVVSDNEGYICGHVAHINCALRIYLAGTVGGSIGLDAEYYCRRCDARTDLVPHVTTLLKTCESIDSRDEIEKILNVGVCILRGSKHADAKGLLSCIESALTKLKCGTMLKDIWKMDEDVSGMSPDGTLEDTCFEDGLDDEMGSLNVVSMCSDYLAETLNLDCEIDQVLQSLRMAQESEYKLAEEQLHAQRKYLHNLYEELDKGKTEIARCTSNTNRDALASGVLSKMAQIKQEVNKLKEMEQVANGFGRTPKCILKEHFGLEIEE